MSLLKLDKLLIIVHFIVTEIVRLIFRAAEEALPNLSPPKEM